jgi:hypothetical protein
MSLLGAVLFNYFKLQIKDEEKMKKTRKARENFTNTNGYGKQ